MLEPPPPSTPAVPPPAPRPVRVTVGAVLLMILCGLAALVGLLFLLFGLLVGSMTEMPADLQRQLGNISLTALGGYVVVLGLLLAGYGAAGLAGGIGAILRRGWGRVAGMITAIVGAIFSLSGIFPTQGNAAGAVVSLLLVGAFGYAAWGLITAGEWFARPPTGPVVSPPAPPAPPWQPPVGE